MEKEVALSLFQCFLEKRKAQISPKVIPGLLAHGSALGYFPSGDSYFDETCWREYGNNLWDLVIDGDETATKLQKPWRECINCIKKYKLEQRMAAAVTANLSDRDAAPVVSELQPDDMFQKYRPIDRGRLRYIFRRPHRVLLATTTAVCTQREKSREKAALGGPQHRQRGIQTGLTLLYGPSEKQRSAWGFVVTVFLPPHPARQPCRPPRIPTAPTKAVPTDVPLIPAALTAAAAQRRPLARPLPFPPQRLEPATPLLSGFSRNSALI